MGRGINALFRLLSRLFIALAALLALRLFFAAARRANRRAAGPNGRDASRSAGSDASRSERSGKAARPPRIDRGAAEDVPYVEVEPEHARRG